MINKGKLRRAIGDYKKDFGERFKDEKYKWEAVKLIKAMRISK